MFDDCQTEDNLNLAYLEALNDVIDVDDSLELDTILKNKGSAQYANVNRQYEKRRDELSLAG
jgi:hypothetical protein